MPLPVIGALAAGAARVGASAAGKMGIRSAMIAGRAAAMRQGQQDGQGEQQAKQVPEQMPKGYL